MAYFPNGSAGERFNEECSKCKLGVLPCPIAEVQFGYNYEACNNNVASQILDSLVGNDGRCSMLIRFPELLEAKTNDQK